MGQGSYNETNSYLANLDFWRSYLDFEARWEELENEDKKYNDDNDD